MHAIIVVINLAKALSRHAQWSKAIQQDKMDLAF